AAAVGLSCLGVLAAAPAARAATYQGANLYTLAPAIPNSGPGSIYFITGDGFFAAGGQVVITSNSSSTLCPPPTGNAVDLPPTALGARNAIIESSNGTTQVGITGGIALLWHGSAASVVNLGPGTAIGVSPDGGQQVGSFGNDAALWTGSAVSL